MASLRQCTISFRNSAYIDRMNVQGENSCCFALRGYWKSCRLVKLSDSKTAYLSPKSRFSLDQVTLIYVMEDFRRACKTQGPKKLSLNIYNTAGDFAARHSFNNSDQNFDIIWSNSKAEKLFKYDIIIRMDQFFIRLV